MLPLWTVEMVSGTWMRRGIRFVFCMYLGLVGVEAGSLRGSRRDLDSHVITRRPLNTQTRSVSYLLRRYSKQTLISSDAADQILIILNAVSTGEIFNSESQNRLQSLI